MKRKYQKKVKNDVQNDESESTSDLTPDEITEQIAKNAFKSGYDKGFSAGINIEPTNKLNWLNTELKIEFAEILIKHLEFKNDVMKNNCNIDDLAIFAQCKKLQEKLKNEIPE